MNKSLISILIIVTIIIAFLLTPIEFNSNGFSNAKELAVSALSPSISEVPKALEAGIITIFYAGASISIALIISLILSFFAAGILTSSNHIRKSIKGLFIFSRAIHELIWALFFVTIFGLQPMSAILALAIPYGGMLGKVFTDIFEQMPKNNIRSLETTGASKLQQIVFGYLPEAMPQLISYGIYRFECGVRSSAILGFVGIAGIGMKIQLMLNDLRFNEMFTYVYVLLMIIVVIEIWSNKYRQNKFVKASRYIALGIAITSWCFILFYEGALYDQLLSSKNIGFAFKFIKNLLGIGANNIAFLNPVEIKEVFILALKTLQMSIVGIGIAMIGMVFSVISSTKKLSHPLIYTVFRSLLMFTRAIPELIWALILVFIFKPGVWVGALALGIHNYGILTKLCSEVVEGIKQEPLTALKRAGATKGQVLVLGVIPTVINRFISYIIYRWEIILRTTIVVGMAGTGGLGYYFKLHFSWFHYTHLTLIMIVYLLLVKGTDTLANKLNRVYNY